ncbi:MAG: hypothetical protein D3923_14805, partial [Candidatus Electrothrix sp. AR3]|nr:hypothetical protein [Candidatus Electrothrix sp. AR3]
MDGKATLGEILAELDLKQADIRKHLEETLNTGWCGVSVMNKVQIRCAVHIPYRLPIASPAFSPVRKPFRLFSFFCAVTVLRTVFLVFRDR